MERLLGPRRRNWPTRYVLDKHLGNHADCQTSLSWRKINWSQHFGFRWWTLQRHALGGPVNRSLRQMEPRFS